MPTPVCPAIYNLALSIHQDIGEPCTIAPSSIETKLLSSGTLGRLDILLNGCQSHWISGGACIEPALGAEEQAIYSMMYLSDYYKTTASRVQAAFAASSNFITIREGDSEVRRADPVSVSKFYLALYKDSYNQLNDFVDMYRRGMAIPRAIDFATITPYVGGYWGYNAAFNAFTVQNNYSPVI